MADDFIKRLREASEVAADLANSAAGFAKEAYEHTGVKSKLESVSKVAKDLFESSGVTDAATHFSGAAGDTLDTLSGAKILALVEERLEIQSKYNDILATKLEEALSRIKLLEERPKQSKP